MSPLRHIPGLNNPMVIKTDMLHTFNLGIGGDLASSGVVALAKMELFQVRSLQTRLDYDVICLMSGARSTTDPYYQSIRKGEVPHVNVS